MENASKALIMAAEVLIGVLILSLAAYLIATFGSTSAEVQAQNEEKSISEFNAKFTVYDGRDDLTIYDIITVANYAKENNENYNLDISSSGNQNTFYINVIIPKKINNVTISKNNNAETLTTEEQNQLLKENKQETKYSCKVEISSVTKRVYKVKFTIT